MSDSTEDFRLRPKRDLFPILSNLVLAVLTAGLLVAAVYRYRSRIEEISLSESRYLTTEWRLLQELKAQTDQKLLEKDQEISELNERYLRLIKDNASSSELQQIQARLQQAQSERDEILSRRAEAETVAAAVPEQSAWMKELLPSENESAVTKLLQKRIEANEAELERRLMHIAELEKALFDLEAASEAARRENALTQAESAERLGRLTETLERKISEANAALADLERREQESYGPEHPRIEDLNTWALVRALAGSPEIRTEYPNLLDSLDRYLDTYGSLERTEGRREAYSSAAATVRGLVP